MELNSRNRGGMGTSGDAYDNKKEPSREGSISDKELRAIAYSMDALL